MNYSELKNSVYMYLGVSKGGFEKALDEMIDSCLSELADANSFYSIYAEFDSPLEFMNKEPYLNFLRGSGGYFLIAATLGAETERKIKRLSASDMAKAAVFDASASAFLEYKTEELKKKLYPELSYTFCPGYQGTRVEDLKEIFKILRPERIGMALTDSGMMIPQKSIAGITAKDVLPKIECTDCKNRDRCNFGKGDSSCSSPKTK